MLQTTHSRNVWFDTEQVFQACRENSNCAALLSVFLMVEKKCVIHRTGADAEIHMDPGCHGNRYTACQSYHACEVIYMCSKAGVMPKCKWDSLWKAL